jgi:DNA-binding IclR family transcriptional regulator
MSPFDKSGQSGSAGRNLGIFRPVRDFREKSVQHIALGAAARPHGRGIATETGEKDRQFATTLARGLDVLRAFGPDALRLGNKDIVARTGLPKATVSRLTYTLTQLGYLRRNAHQNKYELAPQALGLCQPLLAGLPMRHAARPALERLAAETHGTAGLAVCDRTAMVCIEAVNARAVPAALEIGAAMPMLASAPGLAYIAGCSTEERAALLNRLRVRDENGFRGAEASVDAALDEHRANGCCMSRGEPLVAAAFVRRPGHDAVVVFCALNGVDRAAERALAGKLAETARAVEQSLRAEA